MARQVSCALPVGCSVRHPAYLPPAFRRQIRKRFDARGIFLNIPYAVRYTRLELAVIATATAYGLRPVLAKQQVVFDVRFKRILELITSCAFGFTDLSYEKRMNMPFELGIMMAMGKDCFIVSRRKYSGLASISDLSLGDIHYHEADPIRLVKGFSRGIESNCSLKRPPIVELVQRYHAFVRLRRALGKDDFDRLSPQEIVDAEIGARRFFGVRIVGRQ